jgi:hypothetical protein
MDCIVANGWTKVASMPTGVGPRWPGLAESSRARMQALHGWDASLRVWLTRARVGHHFFRSQ